jgi:hypothetical protein
MSKTLWLIGGGEEEEDLITVTNNQYVLIEV